MLLIKEFQLLANHESFRNVPKLFCQNFNMVYKQTYPMKISVEISYYPLHGNDFVEPIKAFIDRLNAHAEIEAITNGISTQVFGEYDDVMKILHEEIRVSFENPYSVFVMKVVNADLSVHTGK